MPFAFALICGELSDVCSLVLAFDFCFFLRVAVLPFKGEYGCSKRGVPQWLECWLAGGISLPCTRSVVYR